MAIRRFLLTAGILFFPVLAQSAAVPQQLTYQGRLSNAAGGALDRIVAIKFSLFDSPAGGTELWSDELSVGVVGGLYSVALGANASAPLPPKVFDGRVLYLELSVEGSPLAPRQMIGSVPYALRAGSASALGDLATLEDGALRLSGPGAVQGAGTVGCTDANSAELIGAGTAFESQVNRGDTLVANNIARTVFSVASDAKVVVDRAWGTTFTAAPFTVQRPIARFAVSKGSDGLLVTAQGHIGKLPSGHALQSDGVIAVNQGWVGSPQELSIDSNQIWKSVTTGDSTLYLQYNTPGGAVAIGGQKGARNDLSVYGNLWVQSGYIASGARANLGLSMQGDRNMCLYEGSSALWCSGTSVSDLRSKRDVAPLGPVLSDLAGLRVIRFKYDGPLRSDAPQLGLVAQEVEQAFPELVYADRSGHKLVHYDKVSAVLVQAIQELSEENARQRKVTTGLEDRIQQQDRSMDELRAENASIRARLERLESALAPFASAGPRPGGSGPAKER